MVGTSRDEHPHWSNRLGGNNFIRNIFLSYSGVYEKKGKTILLILLFAPLAPQVQS